jgi:cation diffusion facilitator CzcD-associated flavoprotein CzcO
MESAVKDKIPSHKVSLVKTNTIIIGASAAGLACAATLSRNGIPYIILEKHDKIATPWRNHYDRLHLNTEKWSSGLPYLPFPDHYPVYISRNDFISYLEHYAKIFNIRPVFNQQVTSIHKENGLWKVLSAGGNYTADHVIVASGYNRKPYLPSWPDMEQFSGQILHSSEYKNGKPFTGKQVLVIGFGNSACEISICLHEHGALPSLSVKGPVNIIPRSAGGGKFTNQIIRRLIFLTKIFPEMVDRVNAPVLHRKYGDYTHLGLEKLPYGPMVQMVRHKKVPLLDIGTVELIRQGHVAVFPSINHFTESGVRFSNGIKKDFDAVIMATGYQPAISDFIQDAHKVTDEKGKPVVSGGPSALEGLYFCGFNVSPSGMLNEIGTEARALARIIARTVKV